MAKGFQEERYRTLVSRLVERRKATGHSQAAFAAKIGKHQQFISRYETGERRLDVVEFHDIATALGLDPARMLKEVVVASDVGD